jgi:hypothetical protein
MLNFVDIFADCEGLETLFNLRTITGGLWRGSPWCSPAWRDDRDTWMACDENLDKMGGIAFHIPTLGEKQQAMT